jgi:hypothetical protein
MSKIGKRLIAALEELHRNIEAGKPMRQHIVRRMKVKGKIVWVHDSFVAPLRTKPPRP